MTNFKIQNSLPTSLKRVFSKELKMDLLWCISRHLTDTLTALWCFLKKEFTCICPTR